MGVYAGPYHSITLSAAACSSGSESWRSASSSRKTICRIYLRHRRVANSSFKTYVLVSFWYFWIIYAPCCVSSDEKEKTTAVTRRQDAKWQLKWLRSLQAVVRCTKMYIRCNILTSEKLRHPAKLWSRGCPKNQLVLHMHTPICMLKIWTLYHNSR